MRRRLIVVVLLVLAVAGWVLVLSRPVPVEARQAGTVVCTANPCIVQAANPGDGDGFDGLVVRGAAGLNHALIVTDQGGAPILYTTVNSVSSGDLPFCATSTDLSDRVCISPGTWDAAAGQYRGPGLVELWACGTCVPVKLTIGDIVFLHKLELAARKARR